MLKYLSYNNFCVLRDVFVFNFMPHAVMKWLWSVLRGSAVTPALIKLVSTRHCLGFRAQLLYHMTTGIQTHITDAQKHTEALST